MSPIPGIAATFDRDPDLVSHPSVLVYHAFPTTQAIRDGFVGVNAGQPLVPGQISLVPVPEWGVNAAHIRASYIGNPEGTQQNEKLVSWWCTAEPVLSGARFRSFQRAYGNGYTHLFIRYMMKINSDFLTGAGVLGGKLPGMTGTYNIQAEGIYLPEPFPYWSPFATWEARLFQGAPQVAGIPLGIYYYGVRAPRTNPNVPGLPSSPGQYDGSGTPGGTPMTSGFLQVDQWHCIEQEIKLNTVTSTDYVADWMADPQASLAAALANAREDGEMRVWLDGNLVYENTQVAFRGEDRIRIQSIPFVNIYQGGYGTYPKGPEHYDLCAMVASTQYVGPPKTMMQIQPATPVATSSLSALAASMNAGTWAELIAADIDAVVGVGVVGNTEVAIPFANSAPWCPVRKRIVIVGGDHGDPPRHIEYDDATNRFLLIGRPPGSHLYQQVAVDPYSGDIYERVGGDLLRYAGTEWRTVGPIPLNISQIASVALAWWSGPYPGAGGHGVLTVYSGNTGTISAFDPTQGGWLADLVDMFPGQLGQYHVVSAYSARHNCLIYGGGNNAQGINPVERQIWRLNADLSKTRMPDAPHPVGINHGMNLVGDSASGNVIAFGFGEAWELNPSGAGSWTQMTGARAPPAGLLSPDVPPNSLISCDVTSFGVVVYIDALRTRQPKCRMWVYKSASGGVNAVAAANYDGAWWNAPAGSETGWGINLSHQGDVIFATWFMHDVNGKGWYLSMTAMQTGPNTFAGILIQTAGPPLYASPFEPLQVQRMEIGNGTLTFSDVDNGTFAYTVNGTSQSKSITRLVFGPLPACTWGGLENLALATNYQGLWWAVGGAESGWGISFTHQGDVIFAMWFTFDSTGAPLPLSGTLTKVGPTTYSGTLLRTSGPPFFAVPFDPASVTRTEVGTTTVTFISGNAATFSYQVGVDGQFVTGTKAIERLVFRNPGTVCR